MKLPSEEGIYRVFASFDLFSTSRRSNASGEREEEGTDQRVGTEDLAGSRDPRPRAQL